MAQDQQKQHIEKNEVPPSGMRGHTDTEGAGVSRVLIERMFDTYRQKIEKQIRAELEEKCSAEIAQESKDLQAALAHFKALHDQAEKNGVEQQKVIEQHIAAIASLENEKRELELENTRYRTDIIALKKELISISQTAEDALTRNDRAYLERLKIAEEHIRVQNELATSEKANVILTKLVSKLKTGLTKEHDGQEISGVGTDAL